MVWRRADWRVVRVHDKTFPAFYRVVSNRHVAEFSAFDAQARERCMALVNSVERTLIDKLRPTKINLASLGNVTPHLHWHVIARFAWDSHFPQPVWGTVQRDVVPAPVDRLGCSLEELDATVLAALN